MPRTLGPIPASAKANRGILLGRDPNTRQLLRYEGQAHMITLAPSGYGKFTNSLGPNLAMYPGSVFCIDPKCQCATVAARARRSSPIAQPVHIMNPFNVLSERAGPSASYNPLDWLVSSPDEIVDNAIMLADALVVETGDHKEDHWNGMAKIVLQGLLVHVCSHPSFEKQRNLLSVRECLQEMTDRVLLEMRQNHAHEGFAAGIAKQLVATPGNEFGSIVSCAQRNLNFLASPSVRRTVQSSSFDLTRIKREKMSVFLVLPAKYLSSHSRWLRMMVTVAMLSATEEHIKPPSPPIVWMLDELGQLGHLKPVADGYSLLRGYGFRIWGLFTNLERLKKVYPEHAESMLNSSLVQGFNVQCVETAEWFAKSAGRQIVGGFGSEEAQLQPVIREDEVRFMDDDMQILKLPGERPFTCKKLVSWSDSEFRPLLDPDPYQ